MKKFACAARFDEWCRSEEGKKWFLVIKTEGVCGVVAGFYPKPPEDAANPAA